MNTKIVCRLRVEGALVDSKEFRGSHVWIGSVPSSDWVLEGVAPRQLLLVHNEGSVWEAISVTPGVSINGKPLDQSHALYAAGTISFGRVEIDYTIVSDSSQAATFDEDGSSSRARALASWLEDARRTENDDPSHHERLVHALIEELRRISPTSDFHTYDRVVAAWGGISFRRKITLLRSLVGVIREARSSTERHFRMHAASTLSLGEGHLEKIYEMLPTAALRKARDAAVGMAQAHAAMNFIGILKIKDALDLDPQHPQTIAARKGLQELMEAFESEIVVGTTMLLALLSRAGGYVLSDEERVALRREFARTRTPS